MNKTFLSHRNFKMANRQKGFGMTAEVTNLIQGKYNRERGKSCMLLNIVKNDIIFSKVKHLSEASENTNNWDEI